MPVLVLFIGIFYKAIHFQNLVWSSMYTYRHTLDVHTEMALYSILIFDDRGRLIDASFYLFFCPPYNKQQ